MHITLCGVAPTAMAEGSLYEFLNTTNLEIIGEMGPPSAMYLGKR